MQRFTVTHSCGHEATHASSGGDQERSERAIAFARQPCPSCIRTARAETAAKHREAWKLPPLQGTTEDIAWAEVIRLKLIEKNRDYHRQLLAEKPFDDDASIHSAVLQAADAALDELQHESRAIWWVENHLSAVDFVKRRIAAAIAPLLKPRA